MIKKAIMILAAIAITRCLPRNAFAPPPDDWEMWSKPGTEKLALSKDLLECGFLSPSSRSGLKVDPARTLSQSAGSMICMERLGYIYSPSGRKNPPKGRGKSICTMSGWKSTDACRLGVDIPVPDPQRRLNSAYCKKYVEANACVP